MESYEKGRQNSYLLVFLLICRKTDDRYKQINVAA